MYMLDLTLLKTNVFSPYISKCSNWFKEPALCSHNICCQDTVSITLSSVHRRKTTQGKTYRLDTITILKMLTHEKKGERDNGNVLLNSGHLPSLIGVTICEGRERERGK